MRVFPICSEYQGYLQYCEWSDNYTKHGWSHGVSIILSKIVLGFYCLLNKKVIFENVLFQK